MQRHDYRAGFFLWRVAWQGERTRQAHAGGSDEIESLGQVRFRQGHLPAPLEKFHAPAPRAMVNEISPRVAETAVQQEKTLPRRIPTDQLPLPAGKFPFDLF